MAPAALATQLDDKRSELQNIQTQIQVNKVLQDAVKKHQAEILKKIKLNDRQIVQLQKDLSGLQAELTSTATKKQITEAQLKQAQNELTAAQTELVATQEKLAKRREAFNARLVLTYKNGGPNVIAFLLGSENFKDLVGRVKLVTIITENDGKLMADMQTLSKHTADKITQVENEQRTIVGKHLAIVNDENRIKAVQGEIIAKRQALQVEQSTQQSLLAQAQREKVQLGEAESMLQASSDMIADQIRTIQVQELEQQRQQAQKLGLQSNNSSGRSSNSVSSERSSPKGFIWPVHARITSPFGWRYHPVLKYSRMHTGIDLGVGSGTPVHAAKSGKVIIAGWMGGYGNVVVIDHGGGMSTLYGHNSKLDVNVGQTVEQGQVISHSGSTGLSTGPHLHFEIRVNGNPQDPVKFLP
ncbi:murein hydrolase activator EnvC family protein [Candidatus Aquicultor sp.]